MKPSRKLQSICLELFRAIAAKLPEEAMDVVRLKVGRELVVLGVLNADIDAELMNLLTPEERMVIASLATDELPPEQRQLLDLIQSKGGKVTCRLITKVCRSYPTSESAHKALQQLVRAGHLTRAYVPPGTAGGRPTELYVVNHAASEVA